jgi:AbiV family abortive infection protein
MRESVNIIIHNAERLLRDAKTLAGQSSYRTAISLAVLSMEESGKACVVCWVHDGHMKPEVAHEILRGHIGKQRIFAAHRAYVAITSIGHIVQKENVPAALLPAAVSHDATFRQQLAKALHEKARVPKKSAELGLTDYFKQIGFYTDVDEKMRVVDSAIPFTQEWYTMVAEDADEALVMAKADATTHHIMAIIYNADREPKLPAKERRAALDSMLVSIRKTLAEQQA